MSTKLDSHLAYLDRLIELRKSAENQTNARAEIDARVNRTCDKIEQELQRYETK